MRITSVGRIVLMTAAVSFSAQTVLVAAAEEPKTDKKIVKTAGPVGKAGVQSTKASGADKVAKSRTCSGLAPKIKKVQPDEGRTGDKITIMGDNLGEAGCVSGVSFGPGSSAKFTQVDGNTVTTIVPEGKRGIELLTLTNSTGEDSKPFLRK